MRGSIAINGRFLTRRTTGVQRHARDIVHAPDAAGPRDVALELICPPGAQRLELRHIRQTFAGVGRGHAWGQFQLPWFAAGSPLLCLSKLAPNFCRNRTVVTAHALLDAVRKRISSVAARQPNPTGAWTRQPTIGPMP